MSQPGSLFIDRAHLTTEAYADSANLNARAAIYQYQRPPADLVGWALGQAEWRGDERVLDVGCGPGRYLRWLAERHPGMRLIGMDLSRGMLADLWRGWPAGLPRPSLAVADAQAIPLPDASCDAALAMHMLYHVPDMARAIGELRRVVRRGGVLLAITNGERHMRELHDLFDSAVARLSGQQPDSAWTRGRFSLENGGELLGAAFAHVERKDALTPLEIPAPEPILAYLGSTRATREPALPAGVAWEAIRAEAERLIGETIAREGAFRVHSHSGVFVCG
jgi:SAM-dependent methyltransferase